MKNEMKGNKKALRILGLNEPTLVFRACESGVHPIHRSGVQRIKKGPVNHLRVPQP